MNMIDFKVMVEEPIRIIFSEEKLREMMIEKKHRMEKIITRFKKEIENDGKF